MNLSINRLYNLSINSFFHSRFLFFIIFTLQKNDFLNFNSINIKITYFHTDYEISGISKKNRVYIIYNCVKSELYSLPKIRSSIKYIGKNKEILNTCMTYSSILYNDFYYSINIRLLYTDHLIFLRTSSLFLNSFLKKCSISSHLISSPEYKIYAWILKNVLNYYIFVNRFIFYF